MNFLIVDGYNIFIRYFSAKITTVDSYYLIVKNLVYKFKNFNIDRAIFVLDKGSTTHKKLDIKYKENRGHIYRRIDNQGFWKEFNKYVELVGYFGEIHQEIGIEGDLVIAYLTKYLSDRNNKVYIMSNDNDFYQLLCLNNVYLVYKSNILHKNNLFKAKKLFNNVDINAYPLFKAIKGDISDNVIGIKGIGEKRILKVLNESTKLGIKLRTPTELYNFIQEYGKEFLTKKEYEKWINNREVVFKNYELVNLLNFNLLTLSAMVNLNRFLNKDFKKPDWNVIKEICKVNKFFSILPLIDRINK